MERGNVPEALGQEVRRGLPLLELAAPSGQRSEGKQRPSLGVVRAVIQPGTVRRADVPESAGLRDEGLPQEVQARLNARLDGLPAESRAMGDIDLDESRDVIRARAMLGVGPCALGMLGDRRDLGELVQMSTDRLGDGRQALLVG